MPAGMTRGEHLTWCKLRALEYLDRGELREAVASMGSDLNKHPHTKHLKASEQCADADRDAVRPGMGHGRLPAVDRGVQLTRIKNTELLELLGGQSYEALERVPLLVLTQDEAAKILRCSKKKIQRLRTAGKLPWIEGKPIMIKAKDLLQCVQNLTWPSTTVASGKSGGPSRDTAARHAAENLARARLITRRRKMSLPNG